MTLLLLLLSSLCLWTSGTDYIRAISVRYKRCPFSYSILSVVVRYYHHHHHHNHHDIVVIVVIITMSMNLRHGLYPRHLGAIQTMSLQLLCKVCHGSLSLSSSSWLLSLCLWTPGTADPDYIRAISVRYRRCPSSYSVRSAVVRAGFELPARDRPKTAISMVPPAARPRTAQAQREKTQLLEELMFFYGRGVHEKVSSCV